jgi:GT2 family glycosyltransferase
MPERDGHWRAPIPPVPDEIPRPLWSVMIPTYNCARYLRETLLSVLEQDPGPSEMQIEVVDDHSTQDDPQVVVEELGAGRVSFHRQSRNVGHTRNFTTCLIRSRGRLIHLLHGDDAVRPGFYATMQRPFLDHPEIGAAFCRYISMSTESHWETIGKLEAPGVGVLEGWLDRIALGQRLQTPCMVVRREVYERLASFDQRSVTTGEDWEMWVRIAAHYPVWYEPEPLALYRVHLESLQNRSVRTGENVRDLRRVIAINREVLPPERADQITRRALEITAETAIRRAGRLLHAGEIQAVRAQAREALRTIRSPRVLERLVFLLALWLRNSARTALGRAR